MTDKRPLTDQKQPNELQAIEAPQELQPLDNMQRAALDLYHRGLNIIPTPRPHEIRAWAEATNRNRYSKPAYILRPLFTGRLHVCGKSCKPNCITRLASFTTLFENANLGVMLGRTSGNLFCVDCETLAAFEHVGAELDKLGLGYWAYTSNRGGGYLMRLKEGEAANTTKEQTPWPDIEILGHRKYCLLPPSLHPVGTIYQWTTPEPRDKLPGGQPPPAVSLQDVQFLGVELAKQPRKEYQPPELGDLPTWAAQLSRRNRDYLINGAFEGERHNRQIAAAFDLAAHVDQSEAEPLLYAAGDRCNPPLPPKEIKDAITQAYRQPRSPAAENNIAPAPELWQKAQQAALQYRWPGRTAQTDRAVFLAACERAKLEGRKVFRLSIREAAELANITKNSAAPALRRLSGRPIKDPKTKKAKIYLTPKLLSYKYRDKATSGAAMYSLDQEALKVLLIGTLTPLDVYGVPNNNTFDNTFSNSYKDLFYRQKVAYRCYLHLLEKPEKTKAAIARATKQNPASVRTAMLWLQEKGLVKINGGGLMYAIPLNDDQVARKAAGLHDQSPSEKRLRLHKAEREKRVNNQLASVRRTWQRRYIAWLEAKSKEDLSGN